ncbi:MAG: bifunctional folylpolyglutamate synthase/dihydrofolate synthase [Candidatus Nealsonbacteria bacterium]|nr:bifunctional folylpolyglutamate synthase/dihydrofolate synthase [Candidatus Nealsonbacteria bacterium]
MTPNPQSQIPNLKSDRREAALRFLFGRIDYERMTAVPYRQQEFKLDRMRELVRRLGSPHEQMPIVHIAGTKGKGSTAAMIAAVLTAAGYRTGTFTSPHLQRIEERLAVDAQPCPSGEFVELVERIAPVVEEMDRLAVACDPPEMGPTYFEITTAAAMLHFAQRKVDVAVLEVGLGGRLDSTNVCMPQVAVITSISFDHTRQLGGTLDLIAREKAGIIKPGVPVVSGVIEDEPRSAIREICHRRGCRLIERGVDFDYDYRAAKDLQRGPACGELDFRYTADGSDATTHFPLALPGPHQAANAAVALATLGELGRIGWDLPQEAVRTGLSGTVFPARVEVVARRPAIVVDAAHNPASIAALAGTLRESFSVARRLLLFAATQEKDVRRMLQHLLEDFDKVLFTQYLSNPRAMPPEEVASIARELTGRQYDVVADPSDALSQIRRSAGPDDLICITGSFFIAAELRRQLVPGA